MMNISKRPKKQWETSNKSFSLHAMVHTPAEYRSMSEPILLEIQQREQEILIYLSRTGEEMALSQVQVD
jgi:hypothetical protein